MKVLILKDHADIKAGTELEVKEVRSNHYGVALLFDVLPPVTLPDISYVQKVVDEPSPKRNRSQKPNEENTT